MKPSEILHAARTLLARPEAWTQGKFARDSHGRPVYYTDERATCWCTSGAMGKVNDTESVAQRVSLTAFSFLYKATGFECIPDWNDSPSRTHAEVLAALEKAQRLAEEQGQ